MCFHELDLPFYCLENIWGFHKHTTLVLQVLLRENKSSGKMLPSVRIETRPLMNL